MTTQEFFNKYNGRHFDYDGYYGFQCVDLYRQYCRELGLTQVPPIRGAADIWNYYPNDKFDRFPNTITAVPKFGDIVIWGKTLNGYGHVAICQSANLWNLTCFMQNYPTGSPAHFQKTGYKHVLGWIRPKPVVLPSGLPTQPLEVAFLSSKIEPEQEFISEVSKYSSGKLLCKVNRYNASFTGKLTQDQAYALVDQINPREKFVFLFYTGAVDSVFYASYYFPKRNCTITTCPDSTPRLLAFEMAHQVQTLYNTNRGTNPSVQVIDSNYPTDELIRSKFDSVSQYYKNV